MAKAAKMDFNSGGKMAEEESEEGGGGSKKLIIIIVLVVLLLACGAAAAYFLVIAPPKGVDSDAKDKASQEEVMDDGEPKASSAMLPAKNPVYFHFRDAKTSGGEYTVSLMDGRGYLRIKLAAEIEKADEEIVFDYLNPRKPLLDNEIITTLATLDSEAARDPNTQKLLSKQIRRKVNRVFNLKFYEEWGKPTSAEPIKRILITNYLVQ
ncbi:MAG: flagellar basal body-associated FliL family protein [Proteobacteria bacterium]|nr:flagellar basal body-associated FliL family protein [Pseudomonadota bacterium]